MIKLLFILLALTTAIPHSKEFISADQVLSVEKRAAVPKNCSQTVELRMKLKTLSYMKDKETLMDENNLLNLGPYCAKQ